MALMPRYPDKHFDLAIVDPPYGIGIDGQKSCICKNPKHNRKEHKKKGWDFIPPKEFFEELNRVSKFRIIWGGNYFVKYLDSHKGWIVWYKGQQGLTASDCELAYSSYDVPARIVIINRVELLKDGTIHPHQKPVALYKWLLSKYAKPGWKILDTHLGSGSSAVACYDMGVALTACEIDADSFDGAVERLRRFAAQGTLDFGGGE
jgi:site-specific DNA-methyltransferase (adenine-specific)